MRAAITLTALAVATLAAAPAARAQTATAPAGGMQSTSADTGLVAKLDSVDAGAKAGLTNLPAAAAVSLIQGIETPLASSGRPALVSIARDLTALRTELGASTVNGARIGAILRRVGPKVTAVARAQSGPVATTLRSIGSQLTTAGGQLAGGRAH